MPLGIPDLTVLSSDPLIMCLPSGEYATEDTESECPRQRAHGFPPSCLLCHVREREPTAVDSHGVPFWATGGSVTSCTPSLHK